jgi:hypothetical protein
MCVIAKALLEWLARIAESKLGGFVGRLFAASVRLATDMAMNRAAVY